MNKIKIITKVSILFGCAGFLFAAIAQASDARFPKKPYRAEAEVISDGVSTPMVMYASDRKMRIEINAGGTDAVQIINFDANEAFMLTGVNGQKMAVKISTKNIVDQMGLNNIKLGQSTGSKKVAQTTCKTYKIDSAIVCISEHNIVLESISSNGTMRINTINIGPQKSSLFEMPTTYKVIDLGAMSGMNEKSFGSTDSIMKGVLGGAGLEDSSGSLLEGISDIMNAENDEATGQAAIDSLMGKMGISPGTITKDDTTAGILQGALNSDKSDADKQKEMRLIRENQRQMKLIEEGGMLAILRDAGMSEEQISQMEKTQAKMAKQMQAHADKNKQQITNANKTTKTPNPNLLNLENFQAEMEAMNTRAKNMTTNGNISQADRMQLQKEAEEKLNSIFGGFPKQ